MAYPEMPPYTGGEACKTDPALFFIEARAKGAAADTALARSLCKRCPLLEACLSWALLHEDAGMWGATTARERRRIRLERGIRLDMPHGYADHGPRQRVG